jgi:hypothetical protein
MLYKTITLELLKGEYLSLYDELRVTRQLLKALDRYSLYLKESHDQRKQELFQLRPGSHPAQTASEALEIAIEDLKAKLSAEQSHDSTLEGLHSQDAG